MQLDILNAEHEKLLQKEFNMTLGEFKNLTYSQMDVMVDDTLMWIECDKDNPDRKIAAEIIDSIYGPYDSTEFDTEMSENDETEKSA